MNSKVPVSISHFRRQMCRTERVGVRCIPPDSVSSTVGLRMKGMGTFSLADSAAGGAPADINRAEVADALGVNRYSANVKWPSGGTNDRELSRFQRCNLVRPLDDR